MSASSKKKLRKEQATAQLTEKQKQQAKEAKKLKLYTMVFCIVVVLVLAIGLVMLVSGLINTSGVIQRSSTALTVGDHELSSAELNYFYIDGINAVYSEQYNYLGMMGLDLTKPLNEQSYAFGEDQTWADYFAELAVDEAVSAYALYDKAKEAGYEMTADDENTVTTTVQTLQSYADQNHVSMKEYLKSFYGNGATEDSFREYLEVVTLSSSYAQHIYNSFTYEQSDIDAHSEAHYIDYTSFSYLSFQVNPNEFTSLFCTAEEGDTEHNHTDEENAAALSAAAEAAEVLKNSSADSLETLNEAIKSLEVYKDSEDVTASETHSMLYSNISNEEIASWLADSSRKPGDKTVIADTTSSTADDGTVTKNPYAYTVVLFLERNDNTKNMVDVRHILKSFSDDPNATDFTDAQKEAAKTFIENLQESWVTAGASEDAFSKLAIANSTDTGSASNGGLYTNVFQGQMVPTFDQWCFDESRKTGDYGIVETDYGYHLIYFVRQHDQSYRDFLIENDLRNTAHNEWYDGVLSAVEHTVHDTSNLSLDLVLSR